MSRMVPNGPTHGAWGYALGGRLSKCTNDLQRVQGRENEEAHENRQSSIVRGPVDKTGTADRQEQEEQQEVQ